MPLIPASLAFTDDGTPYSPTFDDVYHSAEGGLGQAQPDSGPHSNELLGACACTYDFKYLQYFYAIHKKILHNF